MHGYLDVSARVDLVNSIARCPASLSVQVVAAYKDTMVTQTSDPYITLTSVVQLYTLTYV